VGGVQKTQAALLRLTINKLASYLKDSRGLYRSEPVCLGVIFESMHAAIFPQDFQKAMRVSPQRRTLRFLATFGSMETQAVRHQRSDWNEEDAGELAVVDQGSSTAEACKL
jgi:hypothetical protein